MRKVKTNTVTDENGRQRFHGAFTGGFSAGYNNTVGSEQGFQPQQFVSSRNSRAARVSATARDFADEEDGLIGGKLSANQELDTFHSRNYPGVSGPLGDLIIVPSNTVGKKLLQIYGWKQGHGVGPRTTALQRDYLREGQLFTNSIQNSRTENSSINGSSAVKVADPFDINSWLSGNNIANKQIVKAAPSVTITNKLNGSNNNTAVVVHESVDITKLPSAALSDGLVTFAPRNVAEDVIVPPPKADLHGLGYSVRTAFPELMGPGVGLRGTNSTNSEQTLAKIASKYSSGYSYDDEIDVAYDDTNDDQLQLLQLRMDSKSGTSKIVSDKRGDYNYEDNDVELDSNRRNIRGEITSSIDAWVGGKSSAAVCPSDGRPPLPGFEIAEKSQVKPLYYSPPLVPKEFTPNPMQIIGPKKEHGGEAVSSTVPSIRNRGTEAANRMEMRSKLLGESNAAKTVAVDPTSSVFDLLKPEDRQRLLNMKQEKELFAQLASTGSVVETERIFNSDTISTDDLSPKVSVDTSAKAAAVEKPRQMLTSATILNSTFAGLSQAFKNRFTSSTPTDLQDTVTKEGIVTVDEYAAELKKRKPVEVLADKSDKSMKQSGKNGKKHNVRQTELWAPSPLLCKRFNIKVPEISSSTAKLPKTSDNNNPGNFLNSLGVGALNVPTTEYLNSELAANGSAGSVSNVKAEIKMVDDVYKPIENKVPKSVFKSIFEDSDDEDEEDAKDKDSGSITDERNDSDQDIDTTVPSNLAVSDASTIAHDTIEKSVDNSENVITEATDLAAPMFIPRAKSNKPKPTTNPSNRKEKAKLSFDAEDSEDEVGIPTFSKKIGNSGIVGVGAGSVGRKRKITSSLLSNTSSSKSKYIMDDVDEALQSVIGLNTDDAPVSVPFSDTATSHYVVADSQNPRVSPISPVVETVSNTTRNISDGDTVAISEATVASIPDIAYNAVPLEMKTLVGQNDKNSYDQNDSNDEVDSCSSDETEASNDRHKKKHKKGHKRKHKHKEKSSKKSHKKHKKSHS